MLDRMAASAAVVSLEGIVVEMTPVERRGVKEGRGRTKRTSSPLGQGHVVEKDCF